MATKATAKSSGKKTTKTTNKAKPIKVSKPKEVAAYTPTTYANAYKPGTYNSQYTDRLNTALDAVTNWKYDPLQDASYQALAKVYNAQGNIAAKNSMADAAALNGGYGTSYAVSAAQQSRNQYNQQLASLIPDLENAAYNRATGTLSALRDADNTAYGRFRDTEGDKQWMESHNFDIWNANETNRQWSYTQNYNKYRDLMSDYQWGLNYNYQIGRDKVTDEQWAKEYDLKKNSASGGGGGGGGGGRRSGGGGGYSGGGNDNNVSAPEAKNYSKVHIWDDKNKKISNHTVYKEIKKYTGKGR